MTPPAKGVKREATRSPLHEMDGVENLDPPSDEDMHLQVSARTIADIMRHEVQTGLSSVDTKLTSLQNDVRSRVEGIEKQLKNHAGRLEKMEQWLDSRNPTPRSCASDVSGKIEQQLADLQAQISSLRVDSSSVSRDTTCTMVVGGLQSLDGLHAATTWLNDTLARMSGPKHVGTYSKSKEWLGLLWAKFSSVGERDMAVALIRSANMNMGSDNVWATQDLPVPIRARKLFLMGLRWQLIQWGFVKQEIKIDDDFNTMHIGSLLVVRVTNKDDSLQCTWADTWADWTEFQESSELQELLVRSARTLQKQAKGQGKSKGRQAQ